MSVAVVAVAAVWRIWGGRNRQLRHDIDQRNACGRDRWARRSRDGSPNNNLNSGNAGGYGGNGGGGGVGAYFSGTGVSFTNGGTITGGAGGAGGLGPDGGNGGAGGVGVSLSNGSVINTGTITGGTGGGGGQSSFLANPCCVGANGAGGVGISGAGLTITNSGSIAGSGGAITFTGGTNTLQLQSGSTITGNVVAFSTADTLALGGSANASFNVSNIGPSAQYQGFGNYEKTGTSTWTLTGTTTAVTPWTINQGTLVANVNATQSAISTGAASVASGAFLTLNNTQTNGANVTIGNAFTGSGQINLNFNDTNSSNTFLSNLSGFTGAINLTASGTTGDKLTNVTGTLGAAIVINTGTTLYQQNAVSFRMAFPSTAPATARATARSASTSARRWAAPSACSGVRRSGASTAAAASPAPFRPTLRDR